MFVVVFCSTLQSCEVSTSLQRIRWYQLPRGEIRIYQIMLHYVGQPQILYIAGIIPLNVETAVDVSGVDKIGPHKHALSVSNIDYFLF